MIATSANTEIADVIEHCRATLRSNFNGFAERVGVADRDPRYWFDLLCRFPRDPAGVATLRRLRQAAITGPAPFPDGAMERFVLIHSILVAAPQVPALPVDGTVKNRLYRTFANIAVPEPRWEGYFVDKWRFHDMATFATLRRFPAGQHDWEPSALPRSCLLRVHPLSLPGLVQTIAVTLGGFRPLARLHLNYYRPNSVMLLDTEAQKSYHRIARSLRLQPEIKGLVASSWFYSTAVARISPHLSWLRDFFLANGGYVGEMEVAQPDTGYLVGSEKRRRLFEQGKLHPRNTLVLWGRDAMLDWAARHPELND